jgi:hypothetical protein
MEKTFVLGGIVLSLVIGRDFACIGEIRANLLQIVIVPVWLCHLAECSQTLYGRARARASADTMRRAHSLAKPNMALM